MTTIASAISIGCSFCESCAARAVPWKVPRTLIGMPISASACRTAFSLSARLLPSARLYEMVVASSASWWLIELAVGRSEKRAMADSGTIVAAVMLTAWPVAWSRRAGLMGPDAADVGAAAVAVAAPPAVVVVPVDGDAAAVPLDEGVRDGT